MKFVFPNKDYEQKAIEYIEEFHRYSSPINGADGLIRVLENGSYSDWLSKIQCDIDIANVPDDKVPAFTYFYIRESDNKIVGMINICLALNEFLKCEGGHIGYSVRPTERQKGYATSMLREALAFCGNIGLHNVIVTCDKSNTVSAKVIQNCGGILDAEFYKDNFKEIIQRYIIKN